MATEAEAKIEDGAFPECSVEGCDRRRRYVAMNMCNMHYQRFKTYGDTIPRQAVRGDPLKFATSTAMNTENKDCITWPYYRDRTGYGQLRVGQKSKLANRYICILAHGEPPTPKHQAAHSCGKGHEGCVNPMHLSWKTTTENMADKIAHGTHIRGEDHGQARLTEEQVKEILSLNGSATKRELADRYGVSSSTISLIHSRINWAWVSTSNIQEGTSE